MQDIIDELNTWLNIDGVEGIGIGERDERQCIIVSVSIPKESIQYDFPDFFKELKVIFEDTTEFTAQ